MLDELGTKVKLNLFTIVHVWFKDLQPQLLIYWCGWFKHEIFSGKERYIDAGKQPGWRTDGLMIESFLVNRRLVSRLQRICAFLIIHNIIFFSYFLLPLKILCQWTMIVYNLITVKIKPTSLLLLLLFQEIKYKVIARADSWAMYILHVMQMLKLVLSNTLALNV